MKKFRYIEVTRLPNSDGAMKLHCSGIKFADKYTGEFLDKLGSLGWELVSVMPLIGSDAESVGLLPVVDNMRAFTETKGQTYIFKKEIDEASDFSKEFNAEWEEFNEILEKRTEKVREADIKNKKAEDFKNNLLVYLEKENFKSNSDKLDANAQDSMHYVRDDGTEYKVELTEDEITIRYQVSKKEIGKAWFSMIPAIINKTDGEHSTFIEHIDKLLANK